MTPTTLLAAALLVTAWRSVVNEALRLAAKALAALLLLDLLHHAAGPLVEAWRRGDALLPWHEWALRADGALVAGAWPAVVAWLLEVNRDREHVRNVGKGLDSVFPRQIRERTWADDDERSSVRVSVRQFVAIVDGAWRTGATRFVGIGLAYGGAAVAIGHAWPASWPWLLAAPRLAVGALAWRVSRADGPRPPSQRIGQVIAACQVASVLFLWSNWADVRLLSSACWVACAWIAWRTKPAR